MLDAAMPDLYAQMPAVPGELLDRFSVEGLALRRFGGRAVDLGIDFDGSSRPSLVTEILRACTISNEGSAETLVERRVLGECAQG